MFTCKRRRQKCKPFGVTFCSLFWFLLRVTCCFKTLYSKDLQNRTYFDLQNRTYLSCRICVAVAYTWNNSNDPVLSAKWAWNVSLYLFIFIVPFALDRPFRRSIFLKYVHTRNRDGKWCVRLHHVLNWLVFSILIKTVCVKRSRVFLLCFLLWKLHPLNSSILQE